MFQHLNTICTILILITSGPIEARKSSSNGGFSSRGASNSRTGVANGGQGGFNGGQPGGFNSNQGAGGFHPNPNVRPNNNNFNNQGGFHPNPNVNSHGGFHPNNGGFHPNNGGFRPGTGLGSSSSSGTFKKALIGGALGAAGGILAYEAGKAIIKSATAPFNYNNREYHWDSHGQVRNGEFQCSMPLSQLTAQNAASTTTTTTTISPDGSTTANPVSTTPSPDQVLQNIQYQDGSRPKTIVWGCKVGREQCCGTDCCPIPPQNQSNGGSSGGQSGGGASAGAIALIIILLLLLMCCCCCIGAYMCCRSVFDCFGSKDDAQYQDGYNQQQYQMQNYEQPQSQPGYYPQQQQQYGSNYPQSGNYYPPNHYPAQPTY